MSSKKSSSVEIGKMQKIDLFIGNFIVSLRIKILENWEKYIHIYLVFICFLIFIGLPFLYIFIFKFPDLFIKMLSPIATFFGVMVALYLGLRKNKIHIGQNYEITDNFVCANIFGQNNSSCVIEILGVSIVELDGYKKNTALPDSYFEKEWKKSLLKTRLVNSESITEIIIFNERENLDILNPVLKEININSSIESISQLAHWIQSPNDDLNYMIDIEYRRNDRYGKQSVQIPLKEIIESGIIKRY